MLTLYTLLHFLHSNQPLVTTSSIHPVPGDHDSINQLREAIEYKSTGLECTECAQIFAGIIQQASEID